MEELKSPSSAPEGGKVSSSSESNPPLRTAAASLSLSVLRSPLFKIILDDGFAYYVHKELLAMLSPEWRQHTDNQMKEGLTGEMLLRDVDTVTLQQFLQWAYFKEYTIDEFRDPGSAVLLYTKLYVLADRFNVQELKAFNFGKLKELLRKRQVDQTNFTPTMIVAAARYAVANLTSANEDIVDYLLGYLAWIFPSICHLPELASLIREYPDIAIVLLKLTSHAKPASKLSTVNIHTWSQKNPDASPIHWTKRNQVQHPLPSLAFTLTGFDVSPSTNIQLWASYQWVENGLNPAYNAILDSGNNVIHSASCSWLEIPADHPLLRTGTYTMTEPLTRDNGPKLIPIQFSQPFTRNAKVLTFLNGMHFDMDPYWRVVIEAIDANKKGFTLKLSTWHNTIVLGLGVTWVAYPEGTPGITSGVADTCSLRRWSIPQPNNAWYQSFVGNAAFKTTPRILLGLSGCDAASDRNFRLATEVVTGPETNQHGFMWRANTWGDSIMYRTWLAYLAFDPNLLRELAIESKIVQLNESAIRD